MAKTSNLSMSSQKQYKKETTDLSPKTTPIQLSQDKIGEDIKIEHHPKTLKDFLNMFKPHKFSGNYLSLPDVLEDTASDRLGHLILVSWGL